MPIFTPIEACRICKCESLTDVIDLGNQYIASRFPTKDDPPTPIGPLQLCMCSNCWLIQLRHSTAESELYEYEYGYRSGISNTMRTHLTEYKEEILRKLQTPLEVGDAILDIGSNDSTMLQMYPSHLKRIGMDPTGKQFSHLYGSVDLIPTYFTRENFKGVYGHTQKCKVISSISMFYDLPDPVQFAKDIHEILHEDGIWTCEQSYLFSMLEANSLDTICHEHLEYYALHQIVEIAKQADFKIIDVSFNSCNGGSFRIYFAKRTSSLYTESSEKIENILSTERMKGIADISMYVQFMKGCKEQVDALYTFICSAKEKGDETWVYGASTKGNVLLQFAGLDSSLLPYAVERNPAKVGKYTPNRIPIISEDEMRRAPPKYLLVLPWHFRNEIIERESAFLTGGEGNALLFPLPQFEAVYGCE